MSPEAAPPPDLLTCPPATLLRYLNAHPRTELLIVADGSGQSWGMAGGCAAVLITAAGDRKLLTAGFSSSTCMRMELVPFLLAFDWFHANVGLNGRPTMRVCCVSDNETVARQGAGRMGKKALKAWWRAVDSFAEEGYLTEWRWCDRDRIGLNRLCDHMSRVSRLTHAPLTLASTVPDISVYDVNPH